MKCRLCDQELEYGVRGEEVDGGGVTTVNVWKSDRVRIRQIQDWYEREVVGGLGRGRMLMMEVMHRVVELAWGEYLEAEAREAERRGDRRE